MIRSFRLIILLGLLATLQTLAAGCGGGSKKTDLPRYKASGTILVKGKPVAGLSLTLFNTVKEPEQDAANSGKPVPRPTASTKEDGTFSFGMSGDDAGAPAGKYIMTVRHFGERGFGVDKKTGSSSPVDAKYGDPEKSPLLFTIEPVAENQLGTIEIP